MVLVVNTEARKKHKHRSSASRSKTKTKWSSSTENAPNGPNSLVATEEHGYYVKRTFVPYNNKSGNALNSLKSPPYLAIPIAWFPCQAAEECSKINSAIINSNSLALSEGFLCDDDCEDAYEPICGKTHSEVAVFYNKCKLNVAKCRSHGLWMDLPYEDCQKSYAQETEYADKKFRKSPYFREQKVVEVNEQITETVAKEQNSKEKELMMNEAFGALNNISEKLEQSSEDNSSEEKKSKVVENETNVKI